MKPRRNIAVCTALIATMSVFLTMFAGCETGAQTGALGGAGIGALAGQVIGGNTTATLIGAGVGAGVGYVVGNESDKKKANQYSSELKSSDYDHGETGNLSRTTWKVLSVTPDGKIPEGATVTVEFRSNAHVATTYSYSDGTSNVNHERYRVVDDTLILNRAGYIVNAEFRIEDNKMFLNAEDFSAVLEKM